MNRRKALKLVTGGGAGLAASLGGSHGPLLTAQAAVRKGLPPLKITDLKVILTEPGGASGMIRLSQGISSRLRSGASGPFVNLAGRYLPDAIDGTTQCCLLPQGGRAREGMSDFLSAATPRHRHS
jgi:hypothetical protein